MTKTFQRTLQTTFTSLIVGLWLGPLASAQTPYSNPYAQRVTQREARWAYLANQRAKASIPVNYTFAVRPDLATAHSAAAYSPQYQYSSYGSLYANYPQARPSSAYQNTSQTAYRPIATPYTAYANPYVANGQQTACAASPATSGAYYRGAVTATGRGGSPTYVGSSLAGPPKVYPTDQPIRNVFRYLLP